MKSLLRALALTGVLGLGAAAAQAQVRVVVGVRHPAVVMAVPPCPGVGYVWAPGYYAGAGWVPGRWNYRGYEREGVVAGYPHRDYDHGYYRDARRDDRGFRDRR